MSKISIIIPVYNVKEYMVTTIESVLYQTEHAIEIILVNDGSTDGSGQLCEQYALQDSRIKVIHKQNGGLSSARNAGILQATSEYVLLLDGDDYLHPKAIERLTSVLKMNPCDIVQFQYQEVLQKEKLPDLSELQVIGQTHTAKEAFEKLYAFGGVYASGCTKLFRKQLLLDIPFELVRHEDEMWCTRAFPYNLTITYIPDILYGYVVRQGSIIHSQFQKSRLDVLRVKEERIKTLQGLKFQKLELEEWNRLFSVIFTLYRDARTAKNMEACEFILRYLQTSSVMKQANLVGRMKLFYVIAKMNCKWALEIYYLYWKMRGFEQ